IVGIVAVPLAMSFAIASGVKPEYGIYTAIIAGILISLLGGSKFQIGGPTGAFVPILLGIVLVYGYEDLLIAGLMAGVMLVLMGVFRLGSLIKFIPRPVTVGFTAGIAVIIFVGQIGNFFGLKGLGQHEYLLDTLKDIIAHIDTINIMSVIVAAISLIAILLTPKMLPRVPGALVGIVVSTIFALLLFKGDVATIGSTYGAIPSELPQFKMPELTLDKIYMLLGPAFIIAMLGAIESLLSAVVADGMTNSKHNSNKELVGQGIANIVTPLFGGIPATGAIARTATNIKNGATSPMSGVIHGIFVLLTLLVLAPFAVHIPLASLAPVLMVVAWNMSERHHFSHILKLKSGDSLVLVVTFLLTVFTSLTLAVEVGMGLAILLFAKRMSEMLVVEKVLPDRNTKQGKVMPYIVSEGHDCPQISIYTIEGPLFFGAAQAFENKIQHEINMQPKVLILRMRKVPFIDTTGEEYFRNVVRNFHATGGRLLVTGVHPTLQAILEANGLADEIGREHFYNSTGEAIDEAIRHIELQKCMDCQHFAFKECTKLSQKQLPTKSEF
ncbi:MAG: SulP family inorganic anion transporter, partial [Lysinibacillus sp.]